ASDRAPCVGLVTLDAARKTDLGVKLAGGAHSGITTRVAGTAIGYPQQISFCGPGNVTSMVLRLTRIVRETSSDLPLSISLLSELELVQIFAAIALEELDLFTDGARLAHDVRQACENALQIREPWQGGTISQQEITALRATLMGRFPDHPHLLRLDACGYWEALRATISHLSVYDRATILAQLWAGQNELTVLFSQMTQALERLDFSQDVRCGLDAILEFDELERPLASTHSILSGRVICEMMERIEHPAIVATPTGKQLSLSRPMLAALGAELQVEVLSQHEQGDLDADVLEFPRLPLQGEVHRPLAPRPLKGAYAYGETTDLLWRFAQEKAVFLLERATQQHEITALVIVLPIGAATAPDRPGVLVDWLERLQGATAAERDASETALF
ncbi:MAG: virulence factor SrfC family protein, partial [Pseudomonadota bacterium]